jgi:hypothetical protein
MNIVRDKLSGTRLLTLGMLVFSPLVSAQTKIGGSLDCASPASREAVEVDDRVPHTMLLSRRSCVWSRALTVESASAIDDVLTLFTDARTDGIRDQGYNIVVMMAVEH